MIGFNISVDEVEIKRAFNALKKGVGSKNFNRERKRITTAAAQPLVTAAKSNVNVRTGLLKRKIKVLNFTRTPDSFVGPELGQGKRGKVLSRFSVKTGRRLKKARFQKVPFPYYAAMVEGGTKYFKGQNYMKRALNSKRVQVLAILVSKTKDVILEYAQKSGLR